MPELPDLVYIEKRLSSSLPGRIIERVEVKEPIVIRNHTGVKFEEALAKRAFQSIRRHGPFICFAFDREIELIVHPMLAGRFSFTPRVTPDVKTGKGRKNSSGEKNPRAGTERKLSAKDLCVALALDDGSTFAYYDDKKMGKVYLIENQKYSLIMKFENQGLPVLGPDFTFEAFDKIISTRKQQVRAFLLDQTNISAIGNAYGDEILFAAGIHPKTFCHQLSAGERRKLYESIVTVLRQGIDAVEKANRPVEIKVRDHMKVRNRKGEKCPVCGTKIRRESVLGFDTFYCPVCQPAKRNLFLDWRQKGQVADLLKQSDALLSNMMPESVAEDLKKTGKSEPIPVPSATILFTDFVGFTEIAENMSPSDLAAELDRCFSFFDHVTEKHNLEKIKTIGDSYMCAGGVPFENKSHASDAVRAALQMADFMRKLKDKKMKEGKAGWDIRIGIHTGPVVAGVIGKKKLSYDVWGDTVNTASRMESHSEPGKISISRATYDLVKEEFDCESRGMVHVKNKGPVEMFFVKKRAR